MSIVKSTLGLNNSEVQPSEFDFTRNSTAYRVNNIGLLESVASDTLRRDYMPDNVGRVAGWLLEESSENICLYSSDFSNAVWTNVGDGLADSGQVTRDPAGTSSSAMVIKSSGTGLSGLRQVIPMNSGTVYTASIYAKKSQNFDYLELADGEGGGTFSQIFNISDGTIGDLSGTATNAKITSYPNGWYRCEVSFPAANTNLYVIPRNSNTCFSADTTVFGDKSYVWGAMVEALPYATSYIATTTDAVTRAADEASVMTEDSSFNWTVGISVLIEYSTFGINGSVSPIFHYMDSMPMNGSAADDNHITLFNDSSVRLARDSVSQLNGVPQATGLTTTANEITKFALTVEPDRFQVAQNAVLATEASFPYGVGTQVPMNMNGSNYTIKFFHGANGYIRGSGHLKCFKLFPNKLTNVELQSLSIRTGTYTSSGAPVDHIYDLSVTEAKIADGAVTGDKIALNSITSDHLKLDVILAEDIANNAVTFAELANDAVETLSIKDGNVTNAKLADLSVDTDNIIDGNVTKIKIANDAIDGSKISLTGEAANDIMYYDAVTGEWVRLAQGTDGYFLKTTTAGLEWAEDPGAGAVDPSSIPNTQMGSSGTGHIQGTIAAPFIKPNHVGITELELTDGTTGQVVARKADGTLEFIDISADPAMGGDLSGNASNTSIIQNAVTDFKLQSSATNNNARAVSTDHIKDLNVTEGKLAADSVTNSKIAVNAVTGNELADNSVDTNSIIDLNVTVGKLANNAITVGKLNTTNVGTLGQVLTKNGNQFTWADDTSGVSDPAVGGAVSGTISNITINDNAITSSMIAPGVIIAQDIAANAINGTHLQMGSDAAGDILYYDGTDYTRLGVGSNDQVLTVSSGSPAWVTGASGGVSAAAATATAVTMAIALG